jgi:hypothetical protein
MDEVELEVEAPEPDALVDAVLALSLSSHAANTKIAAPVRYSLMAG